MRPETVFIISSLDARTLAEFPRELDPCVKEALQEANAGAGMTPASLRKANVNEREAVAKSIIASAAAKVEQISTATPIPGVVMPKPETGLPPLPITIPSMVLKIPEAEVLGANTLEFQELIPGIKLPAIPLLIPGLEKLPLLPGLTIRNRDGNVLCEGARIPTLPPGMIGIPIPVELPEPVEQPETDEHQTGYVPRPNPEPITLAPDGEYYPEDNAPIKTDSALESMVPAGNPSGDLLKRGDDGWVDKTALNSELEDEALEL